MAILEVKNLKKSFGAQEVLKGINFEMDKGEVVVIIGSSGSGKTTLLRCLNFLETADDGQIIVDGETLFDGASDKNEKYNDLRKKRLHFGLVFQQFNLFPHMNVLKNVKISAELLAKDKIKQQIKELKQQKVRGKALSLQKKQLKEAEFSAIDARAKETLSKVGLLDRCAAYPCELSGGQQQRVAIARAIVNDPKIILADEPTGALDSELSVQVMDILQEISKTRLVIMVTHNAELAYQYCSRICKFKDGELIDDTNPYNPDEEPQDVAATSDIIDVDSIEEFVGNADAPANDKIEDIVTTDVLPAKNDDINVQIVRNTFNQHFFHIVYLLNDSSFIIIKRRPYAKVYIVFFRFFI